MASSKNKSQIVIILSIVTLIPNIGCLLMAHYVLYPPPVILYVVPAVMIVVCAIGFSYGMRLRRKTPR